MTSDGYLSDEDEAALEDGYDGPLPPVPTEDAAPRPWRVGLSWGRTIIESGTGDPDEQGRRPDDRLVGVVETRQDAESIVYAVNLARREEAPTQAAYDAACRALEKHRVEAERLRTLVTHLRAWLESERERYYKAHTGARDDDRSAIGDAYDWVLDWLDERDKEALGPAREETT